MNDELIPGAAELSAFFRIARNGSGIGLSRRLLVATLCLICLACIGRHSSAQSFSTNVAPISFRNLNDREAILNQLRQLEESIIRHDSRVIEAFTDSVLHIGILQMERDSFVTLVDNAFVFTTADTSWLRGVYNQVGGAFAAVFDVMEIVFASNNQNAYTDVSPFSAAIGDTLTVSLLIRVATHLPPIDVNIVLRKVSDDNLLPSERFVISRMTNHALLEAIQTYSLYHAASFLGQHDDIPQEWAEIPVSREYDFYDGARRECAEQLTSLTISPTALIHVPISINYDGEISDYNSINKAVANATLNRDLIGNIRDMVVTENSVGQRQIYVLDYWMQRICLGILELGYVTTEPYTTPGSMQQIGERFVNLYNMWHSPHRGLLVTYDYKTDTLRGHRLDVTSPTGFTTEFKYRVDCDTSWLSYMQEIPSEIFPDPYGVPTSAFSAWTKWNYDYAMSMITRTCGIGNGDADKIYRGVRTPCAGGLKYVTFSENALFSFPNSYHAAPAGRQMRWSNSLIASNANLYYSSRNPSLRKQQLEDTLIAERHIYLKPPVTIFPWFEKIIRMDDGDFLVLDQSNGGFHLIDGEYGDYLCTIRDEGGEAFHSIESAAVVGVQDISQSMKLLAGCYDLYVGQVWNGPYGLRRFLLGCDIIEPTLDVYSGTNYAKIRCTLPTRVRVDLLRKLHHEQDERYIQRDVVYESGKRILDVDIEDTEYIRLVVMPEGADQYVNGNIVAKEAIFDLTGIVKQSTITRQERAVMVDYDIYPNPAGDVVRIRIRNETPGVYAFRVIDMAGRVLYRKDITSLASECNFSLFLGNIPNGAYIASLTDGNAERMKMFMKYSGVQK